jgi:MFS family permease
MAEFIEKKAPLLTPLLLWFMLAMILANLGGGMFDPIMPLYLQDLGATVGQIGLFFTIGQIFPLVLQILGGWLSDSIGRLRSIALGSIAGVFAYIALIAAPTWQWVLLALAFNAITSALIRPSFDAFIAEHSDPENRARLFGITQTLYGIVAVVGPPLGGWLVDRMNFKNMLMIAAGLYFIATAIRIAMAREASKGRESNPDGLTLNSLKVNFGAIAMMIVSGGLFTWMLITDGVRDTFFNMSFIFMPVYMEDIARLSVSQIGLMNGIFGLFMMAVMIPAGWLSDKVGERINIAAGFFFVSIAIGLIVVIPPASPAWTYGMGWAIAGIGMGLMTPAYQSLISKAVPPHLRGIAFGLLSTSLGLISLPAPLIGGYLWEHAGPRFPFLLTSLACMLSIIPIWFKFKLPQAVPVESGEKS